MAEFKVKAAAEIRADYLRTYRAGLIGIGVTNPNVAAGSDVYIHAQALGDQIEIAMANAQFKGDGSMPDTATGKDLDAIVESVGMPPRRKSVGGAGNVTLSSTQTTTITGDTQLVDTQGHRYYVLVPGTYSNGDTVPIASLDLGEATNHPAGDVFKWVRPPAFANTTAVVAVGGVKGGAEAEDDESLRQRLFEWLSNPPAAGNASHVAMLCEQAHPLVQKAFVYPGVAGPGSVGVAVVGYPSDTSKARSVPTVTVANAVKPYLDGLYPEGASTIVTSVEEVSFDVTMAIAIPSSPKSRPPGPGGGWTDGSPWPRNVNGSPDFKSAVVSVTNSTTIVVSAPSAPIANVTQIAWLSPYTWNVYTATVTSAVSVGSYWAITTDNPLPGITDGCLISPNAANIQVYYKAALSAFAALGPGEKLANTSPLYGRAFRHPPPSQSWPYRVDPAMLRAIVVSSDEVQDAAFLYRTQSTAPDVPASLGAAPKIFVPKHIAFYEAV